MTLALTLLALDGPSPLGVREDKPSPLGAFETIPESVAVTKSSFYLGASYQYTVFQGLGADIFSNGGNQAQIEGGYETERDWGMLELGAFATPWGSAHISDVNLGAPGLGTDDVTIYMAGGIIRIADSLGGFRLGAGAGAGGIVIYETLQSNSGAFQDKRNAAGVVWRAGVFFDVELTSTSRMGERGTSVWIRATADYYGTSVKDSSGNLIWFWTTGIGAVVSF